MVFISTKTYLDLENGLGISGVIYLYGVVGVAGWFFFYFLLPETENRTLEDIETHFSTQKITNIRIKKGGHLDERMKADKENGAPQKGVVNNGFVENC